MLRMMSLAFTLCFTAGLNAQILRTDGAIIQVAPTATIYTGGGVSIQSSGSMQNSGTVYLGGDWINNGQGLVGSLPGTVDFNGSQPQFIGGNNVTNFSFLRISNPNAVSLSNNTNVNQTLIFNAGKINTGPYEVRMVSSPANPIIGADANKYVNGNLRVAYNTTTQTQYKYEVGSNVYAPVELTFNNISSGGTMVASTTNGPSSLENFPTSGASGINPSARVNRHWSFSQSGLGYTSFDAEFDYSYSTYSGLPVNYQVRKYTPQSGWSTEISTANGTIATGIVSDGIFVIGELSNTSVSEAPDALLQLAPNPAESHVVVSGWTSLGPEVRLAIVDVLGKEVWGTIMKNAVEINLSLTELDLNYGCYMILASGINGTGTARLIIKND